MLTNQIRAVPANLRAVPANLRAVPANYMRVVQLGCALFCILFHLLVILREEGSEWRLLELGSYHYFMTNLIAQPADSRFYSCQLALSNLHSVTVRCPCNDGAFSTVVLPYANHQTRWEFSSWEDNPRPKPYPYEILLHCSINSAGVSKYLSDPPSCVRPFYPCHWN